MEYENLIVQQLEGLDLSTLYQIAGMVQEKTGFEFFTDLKVWILNFAAGNEVLDMESVMGSFFSFFFQELQASLMTCIGILAVCILSGMLSGISESFGKKTVSEIGNTICLLVIITLCANDFIRIYMYCKESMEFMVIAVQSLLPAFIPLLIASGKSITGAIMNPMILGVIALISTVMEKYILPIIFLSCSLHLVGHMTGQSFLNRTGNLLKDISIFSVGFAVTVLSAFTAVQGVVSKSADSLILKTTRFSVDNFIPIIGGFASDSIEMILNCTSLIKNAVGIWGLLLLILLIVFPVIKMVSVVLVYRIASILTDAVSGKKISTCLEGISSAVLTLATIYILIGILFIIFFSTILSFG